MSIGGIGTPWAAARASTSGMFGVCMNPNVATTRTYQARYRNNDPAFCTVETFNYTNGLRVVWSP